MHEVRNEPSREHHGPFMDHVRDKRGDGDAADKPPRPYVRTKRWSRCVRRMVASRNLLPPPPPPADAAHHHPRCSCLHCCWLVILASECSLEVRALTSAGDLCLITEQPVFGHVRDMAILRPPPPAPQTRLPLAETATRRDPQSLPFFGSGDGASRERKAPRDLILVTSDSGVLSFLGFECFFNERGNNLPTSKPVALLSYSAGRFRILRELRIAPPGLQFRELGNSIVVDPLSRAVCVSALQDKLEVLLLQWHDGHRVKIIKRRKIEHHGTVLASAFLHPVPEQESRITLAILRADFGGTAYSVALCDVSEHSAPVTRAVQIGGGADFPMPLHLISLSNEPFSFLVASEHNICFAKVPLDPEEDAYVRWASIESEAVDERLLTCFSSPATDSASGAQAVAHAGFRHPGTTCPGHFYAVNTAGQIHRVEASAEKGVIFQRLSSARSPLSHQYSFDCLCAMATVDGMGDFIVATSLGGDGATLMVFHADISNVENAVSVGWEVLPNTGPVMDTRVASQHPKCVSGGRSHGRLILGCGLEKCGGVRIGLSGVVAHAAGGIGGEEESENGAAWITGLWSAFSERKGQADIRAFLAVSFVGETKFMHFNGGELVDITENTQLASSEETLCFASVHGSFPLWVVQVHRGGITIDSPLATPRSNPSTWRPEEGTQILCASVAMRDVCVVVMGAVPTSKGKAPASRAFGLSLVWARINTHTQNSSPEFTVLAAESINWDVCSICAIEARPELGFPYPLCVLGTRSPSLTVVAMDAGENDGAAEITTVLEQTLDSVLPHTVDAVDVAVEPHSICVVYNAGFAYLVCGLRDGRVVLFRMYWDRAFGRLVLSEPQVRTLGVLPIVLVAAPFLATGTPENHLWQNTMRLPPSSAFQPAVLALGEQPWRIGFLQSGQIWVSCIVSDENCLASQPLEVSHAAPLPFIQQRRQGSSSYPSDGFIFVMRRGGINLNFVHVDRQESTLAPLCFRIRRTVRRIDYDAASTTLFTAVEAITDHTRKSTVVAFHEATRSTVSSEPLKDDEVICALRAWKVEDIHHSSYTYVAVGTCMYNKEDFGIPVNGRLLLYSLREKLPSRIESHAKDPQQRFDGTVDVERGFNSLRARKVGELPPFGDLGVMQSGTESPTSECPSALQLRLIWSNELHGGAVQCVHQFQVTADTSNRNGLETYLLASCGRRLLVYHLELKSSSLANNRLSLVCREEVRWPITCLSTKGRRICVGCLKDSTAIYDFSPESRRLLYVGSAFASQLPADCALISEDIVMVTDRLGNIYSYRAAKDKRIEECLEDMFAYHYGEAIHRLHVASISHTSREFRGLWDVGWSVAPSETDSANAPLSASPTVTAVVGIGFNGSFISLLNLHPEVFEVLKGLEQVLAEHPLTRPLLGNVHEHYRAIASRAKGATTAVDGDLVTEFLRLRPEEQMTIIAVAAPEFREKMRRLLPEDPSAILGCPPGPDAEGMAATGAIQTRDVKEEVAMLCRIIEALALRA